MMKNKIKVLFVLLVLFVTATTVAVIASDPTGTSFNFTIETKMGTNSPVVSDLGSKDYGSSVSIDPGTGDTGYEFATYIVNGKVESGLPRAHTFIVNQELDIDAYYKPSGTIMVAFMDANQDELKVEYITSGGNATPPDVSGYTMPGHILQDDPSNGPWSGSYESVTSDVVLWVVYDEVATPATHTVSVVNGTSGSGTYDFNEVVTVTAALTSGADNFQYWEIDGMKVNQNPTYSFTVLADTTVTAVYDTPTSPSVDGLFLNLLPYSGIITDYDTYIGQFTLPDGQDLIEYGVITSDYSGGITLNTPDAERVQSTKYNGVTNEFVRHLDTAAYTGKTIRGYMITTDGVDESITYSDVLLESTDQITYPTSVTISGDTEMIQFGIITLTSSFDPTDADGDIYWTSSNDDIASVLQNGDVYSWDSGLVTIYAYSTINFEVYGSIEITINPGATTFVTFDPDNGDFVDMQEVIIGDTVDEPVPEPTKTDYVFVGWWDINTGDYHNFSTPILEWTELIAIWGDPAAPSPEIFISEYGEPDGGLCKYIEIYNPTDSTIDLSNYSLAKSSNGAVLPATGNFPLSSTLLSGETIVVGADDCELETDEAQIEGNPSFPTTGITFVVWGSADWNGNDLIGLYSEVTLIDKIGEPGTTSSWAIGDGNTTDGNTVNTILRRVPTVMHGEIDWTIAAKQWNVVNHRDYSDVGNHTVSGGGA